MIVRAHDVYGNPLAVPHTIWLNRAGTSSGAQVVRGLSPGGRARFEVEISRQYRAVVEPAWGYCRTGANVDGTAEELRVKVPVLRDAVTGYLWPESEPEGRYAGVDVAALGNAERATMINLWAKLAATPLGVASMDAFVERVVEARVDRMIVEVAPELPELLAESGFDAVMSTLHEPPPGYDNGISVKTDDKYGNLQVSIFEPEDPARPTLADVDIDENRETFAHLFDCVVHALTGEKTNHVEVQQILVGHQGIDPGWRPIV